MQAGHLELVIFDCDGVLIDSEIVGIEAEAALLTQAGFPINADDLARDYIGRSYKFMFDDLERRHGKPVAPDVQADLAAEKLRLFETELQPIPDIVSVLDAVPGKFCIASSSDHERLKFTLSITGLHDRFHPAIFSATQVVNGKPAPDLFLFAAENMEVDISRCLVIEDSRFGVEAGKAAGMEVWGFCGGGHCQPGHGEQLLEVGADRVFGHMREVADALKQV